MSAFLLGLHAPTSGATARFHATAAALRAESILWLPSEQVSDSYQYPSALHVVRLDNWHVGEDPGSYVHRVLPKIHQWLGIEPVFQLGNEPEVDERPPHHGEQFNSYASRLRAMVPGIKLANPPLRAENTFIWKREQLTEADYLSCHCYWQIQFADDIDNENLGAAYGHLMKMKTGKPVIVTEVNSVPASGSASDTNVDWYERNRQVALWAAAADIDGVHACCLFIADPSPDWAGFRVIEEDGKQIRETYDQLVADDGGEEVPVVPPVEEVEVMVNASAVVAMAQTQIGHANSGGYDRHNGSHAWAYWCQSFVESTHRNLGLTVTPQRSAVSAAAQYNLRQGRAPSGAAVYFGTSFYHPDGHVGISMGDGRLLGTLTDGSGVGYRSWNESTSGFLGWSYYQNVVASSHESDPPPVTWYVPSGNPHASADGREIGLGGGFLRKWQAIDLGDEPLTVLGWPLENEERMTVTNDDGSSRERIVQRFERGILVYEPEQAFPFDVVLSLTSQRIT